MLSDIPVVVPDYDGKVVMVRNLLQAVGPNIIKRIYSYKSTVPPQSKSSFKYATVMSIQDRLAMLMAFCNVNFHFFYFLKEFY